jgi:hypothetical protein
MRVPLTAWLHQMWIDRPRQHAVVNEYLSIGVQHKHFLADVALRGGVYRAFDPASDGDLANFNGRRELALEIIKICGASPEQLYAAIPQSNPKEERGP